MAANTIVFRCHVVIMHYAQHMAAFSSLFSFLLCKGLPALPPQPWSMQDREDRMEEQSQTASLLCTLTQNETIKQKTDLSSFACYQPKDKGSTGLLHVPSLGERKKGTHTGYPELLRILGPVKHTPVSDKVSGFGNMLKYFDKVVLTNDSQHHSLIRTATWISNFKVKKNFKHTILISSLKRRK